MSTPSLEADEIAWILAGVGVFLVLLLAIVHRRRPEPKPRLTRTDALRVFEGPSEAAVDKMAREQLREEVISLSHVADLDFMTQTWNRAWGVELDGQVHIVELGEDGMLTRLPSEVFCDGRTLRSPFRFLSMRRTQGFAFRIGSYDAQLLARFLARHRAWSYRLLVPGGIVRPIH